MIMWYIDPGSGYTVTSLAGLLMAFLTGLFGMGLFYLKKFWNFFNRPQFWVIILILVLTIIFFRTQKPVQSNLMINKKIIVLGLDALSPEIMDGLMKEGQLKHFAQLSQKGSYQRLKTTIPAESPVAWSAFATGQNPGKNGIFDFITRNPENYQLKLSLSDTEGGKARPVIKSPRFWQYTSQRRIPTVIMGCPVTFPPDPVYGKMLSGMGVPDILGTEGTFSFYTSVPEKLQDSGGGRVVQVKKSAMIISEFLGPRVMGWDQRVQNARVPFKLTFPQKGQAQIEFQNQQVALTVGQFSDWQAIEFDLGLFKKAKAVFKFLLVETEPDIKLYVSPFNIDPRKPFFPISSPANYSRMLADKIGIFHTQGMPFDTWALNEGRLSEQQFLALSEELFQERVKMLNEELTQFKSGVFYFYFEDVDIIQHMFWRYLDPKHPLYDPKASQQYKDVITTWYVKMDEVLGRVMSQLGQDDVLLVLSDHGFNTYRRTVHVNSWLRDHGYLELKDPGAMEGAALLKDIDWSKTKAYAFGFGSIHLNLKGREKQGIVNPGLEAQELKTKIAKELEQWLDPQNHQRVVNKVYRQEDVFWGAYQDEAPDLVIGFDIGYGASWQTALGAVPQELIENNMRKWSGSHLFDPALVDGVIFSNQKINKSNPAIVDLAPTILQAAGFTAEEIKKLDFDGEALFK